MNNWQTVFLKVNDMKQFRVDGVQEALIGHRRYGARVKSVSEEVLYASGGLFARIVDKPAMDALSGGVLFKNDADDVLKVECERLKVASHLQTALKWVRLYGGAAVLVLVNDGGGLLDELNVNGIQSVEELRVYGLNQITALEQSYDNPNSLKFGQPIFYRVKTGTQEFVVHESRLLGLSGDTLPDNMKHTRIAWQGRDAVSRAYQTILNYEAAMKHVRALLERKQQGIYAMAGLYDAISAGMETEIQQRIGMVDSVRGILNTVAVDSEDAYSISDLGLGGIAETLNEFKERLAAECGMPVTLLFGRSAGGISGSHEGDLRGYYDMVQTLRHTALMPALERLCALLAVQNGVNASDNWQIALPPLMKPSAREEAEVAQLQAQTLKTELETAEIAVSAGVIETRQVYEWLQSRQLFGLEHEQNLAENQKYAEKVQ